MRGIQRKNGYCAHGRVHEGGLTSKKEHQKKDISRSIELGGISF